MGDRARCDARITRRFGAWTLVIGMVAAALVGVPTSAGAGEATTTTAARVELVLTPRSGGGCDGVHWLVIDVVDDAVEYAAQLRRVSPNPVSFERTYSPFNANNRSALRGTDLDRPDTATEMSVYLFNTSSVDPCATATGWQDWAVDGVEVTTFAPDPPTPTTAAWEFQVVPSDQGLGSVACTAYLWLTVPETQGAVTYALTYLSSGTPVTVRLGPDDFQSEPPSSSHAEVTAYDTPGRLGHYIGSSGGASGGCDRRMWDMVVNGAAFTEPDFSVEIRTCRGQQPTIVATPGVETVGTDGDDVILGTDGDDVIRGGAGDDIICSLGGDDIVRGNAGADQIRLGPGADRGYGGSGADRIWGNSGQDRIWGNKGADRLRGGSAADRIKGGTGADDIGGGSGADTLFGNKGPDTIAGNKGPDTIAGNGGRDTCSGGSGVDTITSC